MYTVRKLAAAKMPVSASYAPVGYILSPTLAHSILCSFPVPSWLPTYTVPETCFRSGPAVVVKRAESAFSGNKDLRKAVRPADGAALSAGLASSSMGNSRPKSAMIWSAVLRRSDDLSGLRGLIWARWISVLIEAAGGCVHLAFS